MKIFFIPRFFVCLTRTEPGGRIDLIKRTEWGMSTLTSVRAKPAVVYPESDGLPMADNTKQFRWIVTIQGGLDVLFRDEANVFVAGDLLWYPVEGNNKIRVAPDVFVVFGRPKGDRGSYLQWVEGNIAPQVAFEILSPGNRAGKVIEKFKFYEHYGVEEYYVYDPDTGELDGWIRTDGELREIPEMKGWVSPRLKVRFDLIDGELTLHGPDGKKLATYVELAEKADRADRLTAQLKALGIEPVS
jgi:Uma2 family endonuclease